MARKQRRKIRRRAPSVAHVGKVPGEGAYVGRSSDEVVVPRLMDYDAEILRETANPDLAAIVACAQSGSVSWLDIDGSHDEQLVRAIGDAFGLHPLWIEDILNTSARPKVELLDQHLLVIMDVLTYEAGQNASERVALVLGQGWVLSFQDRPGDVWDGVRDRIRNGKGRIRKRQADYLLYALMDAVIDNYLLVVRAMEPEIDALEEMVGTADSKDAPHRVASVRLELSVVRSSTGPVREALDALLRNDGGLVQIDTLPFFRDLADHLDTVLDAVDQARERSTAAIELHLALQNQALNESMRVLALVSTVFIPLSFIAGVYGMNFHHMPELAQPLGYPAVLVLMLVVAVAMLAMFKRRGLV